MLCLELIISICGRIYTTMSLDYNYLKLLLGSWGENGRYLPHTCTKIKLYNLGLTKGKIPLFSYLLLWYLARSSTLRGSTEGIKTIM